MKFKDILAARQLATTTVPPDALSAWRTRLASDGGVTLRIRVRPGKRQTCFVSQALADADLVVDVKAAPVEGEANGELQRFLAEAFGVHRANVRIVHGTRSPWKVVEVRS